MIIKIGYIEDKIETWEYLNIETLEDLKNIVGNYEYKIYLDYKDYLTLEEDE